MWVRANAGAQEPQLATPFLKPLRPKLLADQLKVLRLAQPMMPLLHLVARPWNPDLLLKLSEHPFLLQLHHAFPIHLRGPREEARAKTLRVLQGLSNGLSDIHDLQLLLRDILPELLVRAPRDEVGVDVVVGPPPARDDGAIVPHLNQIGEPHQQSSRSHSTLPALEPVLHNHVVPSIEHHSSHPLGPNFTRERNEGQHFPRMDDQALAILLQATPGR